MSLRNAFGLVVAIFLGTFLVIACGGDDDDDDNDDNAAENVDCGDESADLFWRDWWEDYELGDVPCPDWMVHLADGASAEVVYLDEDRLPEDEDDGDVLQALEIDAGGGEVEIARLSDPGDEDFVAEVTLDVKMVSGDRFAIGWTTYDRAESALALLDATGDEPVVYTVDADGNEETCTTFALGEWLRIYMEDRDEGYRITVGIGGEECVDIPWRADGSTAMPAGIVMTVDPGSTAVAQIDTVIFDRTQSDEP